MPRQKQPNQKVTKKHQCVSRMQKLICISRAMQKSTQFQAVEEKCQPSNIKLFAQTLLALPTLLAGLGMLASCWGVSGAQGQGGQDEASLLGFDIRVGRAIRDTAKGHGQGARPGGSARWHGHVHRPGLDLSRLVTGDIDPGSEEQQCAW
jgi:hypothetical protein